MFSEENVKAKYKSYYFRRPDDFWSEEVYAQKMRESVYAYGAGNTSQEPSRYTDIIDRYLLDKRLCMVLLIPAMNLWMNILISISMI